jgi:plastocyanin
VRSARLALAALALSALGAITCADAGARHTPSDARATSHEVTMRAVSFGPRDLTVRVGDTVVWHNVDIVKHNAVRRELFDTGELAPGEKYAWVAPDTGTYRYQCTIHQRMRGRLTVAKSP